MSVWAWLAIAAGSGALVGLECWAWMRHGTSAIVVGGGVLVGGAISLVVGLTVAAVVAGMAYGLFSAVTGVDPLGWSDETVESASAGTGEGTSTCDPNYEGQCLDPEALDYDCEGGSGDGPEYTGLVQVVGTDVHDLDRNGDGTGCD